MSNLAFNLQFFRFHSLTHIFKEKQKNDKIIEHEIENYLVLQNFSFRDVDKKKFKKKVGKLGKSFDLPVASFSWKSLN